MMRIPLLPLLATILVMLMPGCKKRVTEPTPTATESSPAPTPNGPSAPENPPLDTASPVAAATAPRAANAPVVPILLRDPGNLDKTLADLNEALRKFSFENRRLPKSFSEVIAAGYVQPVPQAPPGKKFEIDSKTKHVMLVNQ